MKYRTPSWFIEFSCLGQHCPDTCCRDWEIRVDAFHYNKLQALIAATPELKDGQDYLVLNEHEVTGDHDYARLKMRHDGYCAFLDKEGLCRIHAAHGTDCLGNVCAMFPRVVNRHDSTIELSGALSCPEVVRLCIETNDPVATSPFRVASLPRGSDYPIQRELISADDDYSRHFVKIRKAMMTIMANEKDNFELRLFMLANLANRLSVLHHKHCHIDDHDMIDAIIDDFESEKNRRGVFDFFQACSVTEPVAMIVSYSVLQIKLEQSAQDSISRLFTRITASLDTNTNVITQLNQCLSDRATKAGESTREQIHAALTRYLVNCLYREWFTSMPDSFTYIQMLLVRTGLLYVLIWLHPDIEQQADSPAALHSMLVNVMYRFAREVDQNHAFLRVIYNALAEQQMMNFDYSPVLIHRQDHNSTYTSSASTLTG